MIEREWAAFTAEEDTGEMEDLLRGKGSPRTLRLFACACCRRIEAALTDPRSRRALETAEQFADGAVGKEVLAAAWQEADRPLNEIRDAAAPDGDMDAAAESGALRPYHAALAAYWSAMPPSSPPEEMASHAAFYALRAADPESEAAAQGRLLGDILGRPPALTQPDPRWLTSTVVSLARGIYEEKAFDRLPILGDALMDAGCDQADLIAHCRGAGPHVRGCWVVDLILAKS